jgi:hypothetical protein
VLGTLVLPWYVVKIFIVTEDLLLLGAIKLGGGVLSACSMSHFYP